MHSPKTNRLVACNTSILLYVCSGIDDTHNLFQGRAKRGVDFVDNPPPSNGDPNGHGTHVAGKINHVYCLVNCKAVLKIFITKPEYCNFIY